MIRADFQQGMESESLFMMNTVTENYWFIYAFMVIWLYHVWGLLSVTETSTPIPCPVDRDNTVPLKHADWSTTENN